MKILFVTSENPATVSENFGGFIQEYICELRKYAEVLCVYFHFEKDIVPTSDKIIDYVFTPSPVFETFSTEAYILEQASSLRAKVDSVLRKFQPDIIHCNDRKAYLPFRFEKNVLYSAHSILENFHNTSTINDMYFQEMKMERCALETSSVLAVYSDFAAKSAFSISGGLCSPVVLPLGIDFQKVSGKNRYIRAGNNLLAAENPFPKYGVAAQNKLTRQKPLRICYFGRIENVKNGINDFIYAVNLLGKDFKEKYNVRYAIFGDGKVDMGIDISLFDKIEFLENDELFDAYKDADIVVVPSHYEPFGFIALEAMATGSLVLLPRGLGMDMYALPGLNCLEIPHNINGIASVIEDAAENFELYESIRENAIHTAIEWSWKRSVKAHLYIYKLMCKSRFSQIYSAYTMQEREIINLYNKMTIEEKEKYASLEQKAAWLAIDFICDEAFKKSKKSNERLLVLTGTYSPKKTSLPKNVEVFSVLNEGDDGLVVRPECLPFNDNEFTTVIASGAWETVIDVCSALLEMQRVCTNKVIILAYKGKPLAWQTYQMKTSEDWLAITSRQFKVELESIVSKKLETEVPYKAVIYGKKELE